MLLVFLSYQLHLVQRTLDPFRRPVQPEGMLLEHLLSSSNVTSFMKLLGLLGFCGRMVSASGPRSFCDFSHRSHLCLQHLPRLLAMPPSSLGPWQCPSPPPGLRLCWAPDLPGGLSPAAGCYLPDPPATSKVPLPLALEAIFPAVPPLAPASPVGVYTQSLSASVGAENLAVCRVGSHPSSPISPRQS